MKNQTLGHIRAANIKSSDRLGRVFRLLQDGNWHGTWEIINNCEVCAVNTVIAELRHNGLRIETRCNGTGRYEYRLESERLNADTLERSNVFKPEAA